CPITTSEVNKVASTSLIDQPSLDLGATNLDFHRTANSSLISNASGRDEAQPTTSGIHPVASTSRMHPYEYTRNDDMDCNECFDDGVNKDSTDAVDEVPHESSSDRNHHTHDGNSTSNLLVSMV
ncbi:hypothetical protein TNCV_4953701, partial [Trichonephila clavipes]